jgi:hypothetical protein
MPVNIDGDFVDRLQKWASGSDTGDEGDTIVSDAEIRDYLDTQMGSFGTLIDDLENLPAGAEQRAQIFTDEVDLLRHWLGSGLVYFDADGNIVENPMINIFRFHDDVLDTDVYEVYIVY